MHPELMPGLIRHEGIGFIMVRSEEHGPLVISRDGVRNLETDEVEGEDPLRWYSEHTAGNLRELDSYQHIGDIFIISMYDPSTEEVAPFEHQVGSHGGLGGLQTKAFVMYPAAFATQDKTVDLVGAQEVNRKIHEWMDRAKELYTTGAAPEEVAVEEEHELPSVLRTNERDMPKKASQQARRSSQEGPIRRQGRSRSGCVGGPMTDGSRAHPGRLG